MAPQSTTQEPRTLADKIWDRHVVESLTDGPDLLAIDLQYVHEASSLQAFQADRRDIVVPDQAQIM